MDKRGGASAVVIVIASVVLAHGMVRHVQRMVGAFRLMSLGKVASAEVSGTDARFIEAWPYRVEYRFEVAREIYQEPRYNGYRARDIGAPVFRGVWQAVTESGALTILYLTRQPRINMPIDRGLWQILLYLYRFGNLLLSTCVLLLLCVAGLASASAAEVETAWLRAVGGFMLAGLYGPLLLDLFIRIGHIVIGLGDMDLLDIVSSGLAVAARAAVPVTVGILFVKRSREGRR